MTATTIASWAAAITRTLALHYRQDPAPLLADLPIDTQRLADPDYRIPVPVMTRLWHQAVAASGDPAFALEVARHVSPTTFHALGYASMASRNLGEALARILQYAHTVSEVAQLRMEQQGRALWLWFDLRDDSPKVTDDSLDAFMAALLHVGRHYLLLHPQLHAVKLRRAAPAQPQRYHDFFGTTVEFGCSRQGMSMEMPDLTALLPTHNPALVHANEQLLRRLHDTLTDTSLKTLVMQQVEACLPDTPRQDDIARALHLSVRSLQRKLETDNVSFHGLVDEVRYRLARQRLADPACSIQTIADGLGFANPSAFTRAFRRWSGMSPAQFRAQATSP